MAEDKKLTATGAAALAEQNQLNKVLKLVESAASSGKRKIFYSDNLYPKTLTQLKEMEYVISDNEETDKIEISW